MIRFIDIGILFQLARRRCLIVKMLLDSLFYERAKYSDSETRRGAIETQRANNNCRRRNAAYYLGS